MIPKRVHQLFSNVAQDHAGKIAIDRGDRRITYRELDVKSNGVANALLGSGPVGLTAIVADDSIEVVTAMLGVLKAGGIFVPLDPNFPLKRLETMAAQVQPEACLVGSNYADVVKHIGLPSSSTTICLDAINSTDTTSSLRADGEQPCSIYFTSGSTGRPKAILGRLSGIDHFVRWEIETLGIKPGMRVSQLASPSFDGFLKTCSRRYVRVERCVLRSRGA